MGRRHRELGDTPPFHTPVFVLTGGDGFDVIFDTVGGATLDASFASVRRDTGHVVSILGWGTHNLAPLSFRGATYSGVFSLLPLLTGEHRAHRGAILRETAILADAGKLTPNVDPNQFTLDTVPDATKPLSPSATLERS